MKRWDPYGSDESQIQLACSKIKWQEFLSERAKAWFAWHCPQWEIMGIAGRRYSIQKLFLFNLPEHEQLSAICLLWCWWTERNKENHGQNRMTPGAFHFNIWRQVQEWEEFLGRKPSAAPRPVRWLGMIARDNEGMVICAASGRLAYQSRGSTCWAFETNCLAIQQAVSSSSLDRDPLGVIFREAKYQLQLGFIEFHVSYCPRVSNQPAHVLPSLGCRSNVDYQNLWPPNLPLDVTVVVTADLVGPL